MNVAQRTLRKLGERKITISAALMAAVLLGLHILTGLGHPDAPFGEIAETFFDVLITAAGIMMVLLARQYEKNRYLSSVLGVAEEFQAKLEDDLESASIRSIKAFARAIDARDSYTAHHSGGVTQICTEIAEALGLEEKDRGILWQAGFVHDIGKIGIPDNVLLKPGRLTEDEFDIIKSHPELGATLLQPIKGLEDVVIAVRTHHERWDGKGYPYGLKGEDIPLLGRIMAVADSFEAMTSARVYRRIPLSIAEAAAELIRGKGTQFDPAIVDVMIGILTAQGRIATSVNEDGTPAIISTSGVTVTT